MPVQRKVFRIEEQAHAGVNAGESEAVLRHRDFMAEMQALRALIAPNAPVDRVTMERARAQIAEAQAYKAELDLIGAAVRQTKELDDPSATVDGERGARAVRELQAIVAETERATTAILQATEAIEQTVSTLAATLESEHDQGLAQGILERVIEIYGACNFQDLTSQRVASAVAALRSVEERIARLQTIWRSVESFTPVVLDEPAPGQSGYLNGPKLPGDRGHSSQDDIDGMFAGA